MSKKIMVNVSLKIEDETQVIELQKLLDDNFYLIDFSIKPNTEKMYELDKVFRMLVKQKKEAGKKVSKYINDNNNRYENI